MLGFRSLRPAPIRARNDSARLGAHTCECRARCQGDRARRSGVFAFLAAACALQTRETMRRFLLVVTFAALAGPSLGACNFHLVPSCEDTGCSFDCPEQCPPPDLDGGGDGATFVPPTPPESCPADADRICADGYLYRCTDGAVTSQYFSCAPGTTCTETVTSNGRRGAACWTGDAPCASDAPMSAECRGDDRINCEYGLVTRRGTCVRSKGAICWADVSPAGYPTASCTLAN